MLLFGPSEIVHGVQRRQFFLIEFIKTYCLVLNRVLMTTLAVAVRSARRVRVGVFEIRREQ